MRIIIIGSGIAGLSTAIALQKIGCNVTLYERTPELREVGAGISLWTNALRALDYLDAGQAVRACSAPLRLAEIRANEGRNIQLSVSADVLEKRLGLSPVVAMIHRAELVAALARFVAHDSLRYGFELTKLTHEHNRVRVEFSNGHTDNADAVIGADGINSIVRASLFGNVEPRYSGYTCWRGISARPASIQPGYFGEWWGRGKRFGITTLTNNRVYWFAVHNANRSAPGHSSELLSKFQGWACPVEEIIASTPEGRLIQNDIVDLPPSKTWSQGNVVLVGDAAHPTTPNLGQGGCLAIEDAVALARAISQNPTLETAFIKFNRERYKRAAAIVNESWRFGKMAKMEGRFAVWIRDKLANWMLPRIGITSITKHAKFDIGDIAARQRTDEK